MEESEVAKEEEQTWGDRLLVERDELSPRHRKLAELAAQGLSNKEIKERLQYKSDSQISIILSNTRVRMEIERIRERIYQETIGKRLKDMAEPALNEIAKCLTDRTNRYKENLKVETAKWLIEKLDGKAIQKHDIGENLLGVMMDKLDAMKSSPRNPEIQHRTIDVTPSVEQEEVETKPKTEESILLDWIADFTSATKS